MSSPALFNALSTIHPISEGFKETLRMELIPISMPKNHILLEVPRIAEYVYFIESGFAMSYSRLDGKKNVEAFWKTGQIMTVVGSFYEQAPSTECIQLMESSELLCLSHAGLHRMFEKHKETHYLYHKLLNRHYAKCRARISDIQRLSAAERLELLLVIYPEIEQIIPQENIASYLSITPQSLSRIKREKGRTNIR